MNENDTPSTPADGSVEREVRPVAWRAPNWSHSPDDYAYYDADDKPECRGAAEPLYGQAELDAAVAAERERCAKLCDTHARGWEMNPGNNPAAGFIAASNCAHDIRARPNAQAQRPPGALER
jgi:hypothetical protein